MARRGASLGLCARSERPLADVARECEVAGAAVLHRAVDVADEEAVEAFAAAAEGRFGRIDVWVNNAATMAYGPFEQIPSAVFRRIVETNLMGMVHGARAALPRPGLGGAHQHVLGMGARHLAAGRPLRGQQARDPGLLRMPQRRTRQSAGDPGRD